MRRLVATAALGAVVVLVVPVHVASACTVPAPLLTVDRTHVVRGASLTVSASEVADADGRIRACDPVTPPPPSPTATPSETATPIPTETAEPSTEPSESSLGSLAPVAYAVTSGTKVVVTIEKWDGTFVPNAPNRTIAEVDAGVRTPYQDDLYTYSFTTTVTIPSDLAPRQYRLNAYQPGGVHYGSADIQVMSSLPDTGSSQELARLAVLALVLLAFGTTAVVAARRH